LPAPQLFDRSTADMHDERAPVRAMLPSVRDIGQTTPVMRLRCRSFDLSNAAAAFLA
jgi:hypothetical protein